MEPFRQPMCHCRAGVARRDITPPVGIYNRNWGAALYENAAGVHRPFTATVLCLTGYDAPDEPPHVLVALDLGWLGAAENRELLDRLTAAAGVGPERLLVMLSHTHAGPNLATTAVDKPGGELLRPYFESVIEATGAAINAARDVMEEAWIAFGAGRCALAANRDTWDDTSQRWVCGFNPAGTADDTLLLARLTNAAGAPLATLVNYGCHPTTLGPENRLLSPDYVGAMREVLEGRDGAPVLFMLGACGETGPRDGFTADTTVADRNGRGLGFAAAGVLELLPPPASELVYAGPVISGATLGAWEHRPLAAIPPVTEKLRSTMLSLALPLKPPDSLDELQARHSQLEQAIAAARARGDHLAERDATAHLERTRRRMQRARSVPAGDRLLLNIWLWKLGDACVVAIPAEPYSLLQTELRRRFPGRTILVSTVTNGSVSYLLPRELYGSGLYQDWVSVIGPGGLELVIEAVAEQLQRWGAESVTSP